ncbi:hypothetical protein [Polymorphospora rubra]|uniref:Uncharacterized protein n=1 Tax=Polymorphospora rubra TaxID=338584 RepID=A0A810MWY3_9ACTN|nr:hypothetical protein [Polymorphospora rubra]BCJ64123.1 hypothetical protein Prubr_11440 [Polymorphospora rubra]
MTTTVTVGDLHKVLDILIPFTASDSYEAPTLAAVHIEAAPCRGGLVGQATDRYVVGHMRVNATGDDLAPTLVPRRWAKVLRRALSAVPENTLATLRQIPGRTRSENRLEVSTEPLTISIQIGTGTFPDLSKAFKAAAADGLTAPWGSTRPSSAGSAEPARTSSGSRRAGPFPARRPRSESRSAPRSSAW